MLMTGNRDAMVELAKARGSTCTRDYEIEQELISGKIKNLSKFDDFSNAVT